jgi:hypothetical protein
VITRAVYGVLSDPAKTRNVFNKIQALIDAGVESVQVRDLATGDDPALGTVKTLKVDYTAGGRTFHVSGTDLQVVPITCPSTSSGVVILQAEYGVLGDPTRTRDVKSKLQQIVSGGSDSLIVGDLANGDDPAFGTVKTLSADYTVDGRKYHLQGTDKDTIPIVQPNPGMSMRLKDDRGNVTLEAWKNGLYTLTRASGTKLRYKVTTVPKPVEITSAWTIAFPPNLGAPAQINMARLASWSINGDAGVRYFSGTATYNTTFTVRSAHSGQNTMLDLGEVHDIAEVSLNGKDLGILWHAPYRVDVTDALHTGPNTLVVKVTNLWVNRMIGDEQLPPDSDRNGDGTLKSWPVWLNSDSPSPTGRYTFTSYPLWRRTDPLQPSGLLGPVVLAFSRNIEVGTR